MESPEGSQWHLLSDEEVFTKLKTCEDGLSDAEAALRLKEEGLNELIQKDSKSVWRMIIDQLSDHMVIILFVAAVLSAVLNEWIEAIVILVIIVLDATIGVIQEKKATDALNALKKLGAPHAKVLRNDESSLVLATELVLGDVVYLEAGDIVPADMRIIEANDLQIQEASLTGESLPVAKDEAVLTEAHTPLGDRLNMAYMSTIVTNGNGWGVVTAKGMATEVGKIADSLSSQEDEDTPLTKKLNNLGRTLTIIGLIVCVLVIALGLVRGMSIIPLIMTSISLAISIIPEGLPATATIVMALGVERMAKEQALVKGLPNVETLGSATVICTDKTGTLTENRMTVTEIAVNGDFEKQITRKVTDLNQTDALYRRLIDISLLCNTAEIDPDKENAIIGDPTEGALLHLGQRFENDITDFRERYEKVYEQPFDSDRKLMTTVNLMDNGQYVAHTKGAVEEVLQRVSHILDENGVRPFTQQDFDAIINLTQNMAQRALRVLAMAYRRLAALPDDDDDVEHDLIFVGVTGMIDPPRQEVLKSIKTFHQAGMRVVMITGDHPLTALAIAKSLGIFKEGNIILTSDDLRMKSNEELKAIIQNVTVFSRVSPQEKLRIVQLLNEIDEVTAMTGDGVNDSPSLKAASIGIAMGSGTEVSKDAADVILLDDDFTTIEQAIREGRRIYRNIQKVVQFLVAGNVAEILVILIALVVGWEQPILAIHILLINLVTDNIPAIALGVDPADNRIMTTKPIRSGSLFADGLGLRIVIHGLFITIASVGAYYYGITHFDHNVAMTMTFFVLAISQLFHALNQRSNIDSVFTKTQHNRWLFVAMLMSAIVLAALVVIAPLRTFFKLAVLSMNQWLIVFGLSLLPLVLVEIYKLIYRLKLKK